MPTPGKQTIYVDVDDEITTVIDKLNTTDARVIALVLPKRATMFQSVVNMKLLKRRAESAGKHLVLITSENGLLPLAGMAGIHVAKTLQSKPEIPGKPAGPPDTEDVDEDAGEVGDDFDADAQAQTPVGQLTGSIAPSVIRPDSAGSADNDVIELDNAEPAAAKAPRGAPASAVKGAGLGGAPLKGKKQFSVPDFLKFRKWLFISLGLVLLLLIGGYVLAYKVLPSATVTVGTNSSDINASLALTLDTSSNASLNEDSRTVPAQTQQQQKSYTQQVPASGKKNKGNKAGGQVTISTPCSANVPSPVPAGSGVSANGLTYITQDTVNFNPTTANGSCVFTGSTNATAQQGGAQYNIGASDMTVAGRGDVSARTDGGMNGGSDDIVKVVTQSDIDSAKQKLNSSADQAMLKQQLQRALEDAKLLALTQTFSAKPSAVNSSAQPDDESDNVTVNETITYIMYGVKRADLSQLVGNNAKKKIDTAKQSLLDDGINQATFTVRSSSNPSQLPVQMEVTSTAGPHLDKDALAQSVAGKKTGDVKSTIGGNPGVRDVDVSYSPFWVTSMPKNPAKINIVFAKAGKGDSN